MQKISKIYILFLIFRDRWDNWKFSWKKKFISDLVFYENLGILHKKCSKLPTKFLNKTEKFRKNKLFSVKFVQFWILDKFYPYNVHKFLVYFWIIFWKNYAKKSIFSGKFNKMMNREKTNFYKNIYSITFIKFFQFWISGKIQYSFKIQSGYLFE